VTLTSGGVFHQGARTDSNLTATLDNNVSLGSGDTFATNRNIEFGSLPGGV
jgi:hypothetical protein